MAVCKFVASGTYNHDMYFAKFTLPRTWSDAVNYKHRKDTRMSENGRRTMISLWQKSWVVVDIREETFAMSRTTAEFLEATQNGQFTHIKGFVNYFIWKVFSSILVFIFWVSRVYYKQANTDQKSNIQNKFFIVTFCIGYLFYHCNTNIFHCEIIFGQRESSV